MSQACCSLASLITYATNCALVAVTGGTGRCGLMGTGCMMGLLDVSRTGVFVRTSTNESNAAMVTVKALDLSPCLFGVFLGVRSKLIE